MRGRRVPWTDGAVFLSDPELKVQLRPEGRAHVYGPQGQRGLARIGDYIATQGQVDASVSKALATAIQQAGIRQSQRARTVGSFRLEMPAYQEGPGWQDFVGRHQRFTDDPPRRIRIYLARGATRGRSALSWCGLRSGSTGRFGASSIRASRCLPTSWSTISGQRLSSGTTPA